MIQQWIIALLSGPFLKAWETYINRQTSVDQMRTNLALKELELQHLETALRGQLKIAQIGHWYEVEKLFAYITLLFYGKVVIWDKVLGVWTGGRTDPLTGEAAVWAGLVMSFYFAVRGAENVARILKR